MKSRKYQPQSWNWKIGTKGGISKPSCDPLRDSELPRPDGSDVEFVGQVVLFWKGRAMQVGDQRHNGNDRGGSGMKPVRVTFCALCLSFAVWGCTYTSSPAKQPPPLHQNIRLSETEEHDFATSLDAIEHYAQQLCRLEQFKETLKPGLGNKEILKMTPAEYGARVRDQVVAGVLNLLSNELIANMHRLDEQVRELRSP
jgi:hypothetical protein